MNPLRRPKTIKKFHATKITPLIRQLSEKLIEYHDADNILHVRSMLGCLTCHSSVGRPKVHLGESLLIANQLGRSTHLDTGLHVALLLHVIVRLYPRGITDKSHIRKTSDQLGRGIRFKLGHSKDLLFCLGLHGTISST